MRRNLAHLAFLCALGTSGAVVAQAPAEAPGAKAIRLTVAAQPIAEALNDFARQSGLQVVIGSEIAKGVMSRRLDGTFTPDDALARMLSNTGLRFEYLDPRTIAVLPASEGKPAASSGDAEAALRFAQAESNNKDALGNSALRSSQGVASERSAAERATIEEIVVTMPEILVKGARTMNVDIQRTEDDTQPYVVFGQEEIQRSAAANLEDFLKTRLPMNTVQNTNSQNGGGTSGGQSSINLRGLGANQTLILVDGRRMPSVNSGGQLGQPDINGIPMAAIERIEVLPATASGIYGGGATGGVVNIITRKDYDGVDVRATYGNAFDTDVTSRRLEASAGLQLEGGRTRVMFTGSYADANSLLTGERDLTRDARYLQFANNPGAFLSTTTPPVGYTTNIRSQNGQNLVLDNGTSLGSPRTFVPIGYAGVSSDGGAALVANAGQYNLDLPETVLGARQNLLKDPSIGSASLNIRREFTDRVEGFLDVSWLDNGSRFLVANVPTSVTLQANAANNPFDSAINVSFPAVGLEAARGADSQTFRAAGGVIVRLPRDWTAAFDYVWSRARLSTYATNLIVGDPDGPSGPGVSVDTALGNGTLDVMRDLNAFPLDFSAYLLPSPNVILQGDTFLKDATLRLSGPIFRLPAGPLTLSALVEHREEEAGDTFQDRITSATNPVSSTVLWPSLTQEIRSYYLEARAPLILAKPFMHSLELQASVRRDEYDTRVSDTRSVVLASRDASPPPFTYSSNEVSANKYTLGLRYAPVQDLAIRASFGTGFLPPSIDQLQPNVPTPLTLTLTDPKRGGVAASTSFNAFTGGNVDLEPEDSESWSLGLIYTPRLLPQFRLSLDYTRIEKVDELRQLTQQQILDLEDLLPERVVRSELNAEDIAAGYTGGEIVSIDTSFLNIADARLEAYDLQVDYSLHTDGLGSFHFYTIATRMVGLERRATPSAEFVESVGFTSGQLEWRGNAGIDWNRGPWTLGWSTQYFDGYFAYPAGSLPAAIATATLNQGSNRIPSQTYHDVFARYRFDESSTAMAGALADSEILIGFENVLDESPPILAVTGTTGGYSTYGDPRLRRFSVSVRKRF